MTLKRRQVTRECKLQVVREVEGGKRLAPVARESEVPLTQSRRWCQLQQH